MLTLQDLDEDNMRETEVEPREITYTFENESQGPKLSVYALNCTELRNSHQTMKLIGHCKRKQLHILVDSGSTNNFIDYSTAKSLSCVLTPITPVQVAVANGQVLMCSFNFHKFTWKMNDEEFFANFMC